ncbi:MAG: hypothetical protein KDK61_03360, partial [Simkania sp.]|nr:hypothetical protein [Simkania sp.]
NEVLVDQFLEGKISWLEIGKKLETLMGAHQALPQESFETLLEVDQEARAMAALHESLR